MGSTGYERILVLTGAGVSAESGIPTFRDGNGLWENHHVEDVATPEGFLRNPDLVHRFYNERRRHLLSPRVAPNPAHLALGRLENGFHGEVTVVTQNVDNLHERAGSRNVIHMHGELLKALCEYCGKRHRILTDLGRGDACPDCGRIGGLRPDIVWFGELPYRMELIDELLRSCDLFIAAGTSGSVYPAAGFVRIAAAAGAETVEVNLHRSDVNADFSEYRPGPAGEVLPRLVSELLGGTAGTC